MKFNLSWRVLFVLLPLELTSAFGQADVRLVCDSTSASKSKCGFGAFGGPDGAGYLQINCDGTYTNHPSGLNHYYLSVTCSPCPTYTGSSKTSTIDPATCLSDQGFGCVGQCNGDICPNCFGFPYPCGRGFSVILDAGSEYTTATLISNTEAALPSYDDDFNDACSASRDLSVDESSFTIQRFKYKFTFPTATQGFVIHWVERFTPTGNGSPSDTSKCEPISIGTTESSVHEVLEPSSNGTITIEDVYIDAATVEVESASIRDGEFVITAPALDPSAATGTLDLIFERQGSNDQIVVKTFENQPPGTITVRLDDVMNVGVTPLDGEDGIVFDRAAARWRIEEADVTSADRNFDVPVEVLSQRTLSNYFSPTWGGRWRGGNPQKGVYPAGQFPTGLYNVHVRTQFLDALDPNNEGLAMDGNTVIRAQVQPAQRGFPQYIFLNGTDRGYIEFPDRDQRNTASDSTVQFLRSTSVAVRPDADRLSYRTADEVYVPGFGIRTVDDAGELHSNIYQIDLWIGQGDSMLKAQADEFGIRTRTCLKILNQ